MRRPALCVAFLFTATFAFADQQAEPAHGAPSGAAAHGSEEGGHGNESVQTWKLVNFGLLAVGLGWVIAKNAGPFFRGRTETIRQAIDEARQIRADAEARAAEIDRRLASLGSEIEKMSASAREEMSAESSRIQEETRRLSARLQAQAEQEIASAGKNAEAELHAHAARLALDLAEKKVRARMTPDLQGSLVERFVASLPGLVSSN